ncbi:MAG: hypothetical protein J5606_07165 [Bacteroidales bacterium]|nr:hypothetical protein [Bacteroidales bacterium]
MSIDQLLEILKGELVTECEKEEFCIERGFASDLMSDVLTIPSTDKLALITGLSNLQTIRTAEMAGINMIIIVRGKKCTPDMISLAEDNDIVLIETPYSAFHTSAILFNAGIKPLF